MQAQAPTVFDTKPLLRPKQLEDAKSELKALEAKITDKGIEDKAEAMRQYRRVSKSVNEQTPQPPVDAEEEGKMVARERELREKILEGMPSQEEMRKAPPGAVDKHIAWERRNKRNILEWKNIRLRLSHGEEAEAANLERYRPTASTLSMDNAHIAGKNFFMPETTGPSVIITDEEYDILVKNAPEIAFKLALLDNRQRTEVKAVIRRFIAEQPEASVEKAA